eukprot:5314098-Prymnesium_polylepis.1
MVNRRKQAWPTRSMWSRTLAETHGSFQTVQRLSASPVAKLKVTAGPLGLGRPGRKRRSEAPEGSKHDRGSG